MIIEKKDQESAKKICEDAYKLYIDLYNKDLNSRRNQWRSKTLSEVCQ